MEEDVNRQDKVVPVFIVGSKYIGNDYLAVCIITSSNHTVMAQKSAIQGKVP